MDSRVSAPPAFRQGGFRQRIAWVFTAQVVVVTVVSLMGVYGAAPALAVVAVIVFTMLLAWLAVRHEWHAVRRLAKWVGRWSRDPPDPASVRLDKMSVHTDPDVVALAQGLHGFATRLADYTRREHSFTRDASHELRSPLTVIKMSVEMLGDEPGLSDFGARSVRRIRRASLEMEAMVEALLTLAREPEPDAEAERFVVNDVLRNEIESAREVMSGRPIELQLEESARFALAGSARSFSVLCWQLIRNACQQIDEGRVVVRVTPGMISVSNAVAPSVPSAMRSRRASGAGRHGFELAIARRISDRFAWPLDLQTSDDHINVARVRFANPLPAEAVASRTPRLPSSWRLARHRRKDA